MQFVSPLSWAAWAILGLLPPALLALYFLKLRRRPVQVSSTMLWQRSLEDLHVNSLFQRLRRNLLLFLQMLILGLVLFALLGPRWTRSAVPGQRYILAIDVSASMGATDVEPSRLERARKEARAVIDRMESGAPGMILAFNDRARVVATFTTNKGVLRQRLQEVAQTEGGTSLREALEVASGLANPASDVRARNLPQGVIATEAMAPTKLYVFTDGGFPDLEGFSVGKLEPEVVVIGAPPPPYVRGQAAGAPGAGGNPTDNVAILALQAGKNAERPDQVELFGRVRNYRGEKVPTTARLLRHDPARPSAAPLLVDALELELEPRGERGFQFSLPGEGSGAYEVSLDVKDDLALDDRAFVTVGETRAARVLLVTRGNRYLSQTLSTTATQALVQLQTAAPEALTTDAELQRGLRAGLFDLVVFDGCAPVEQPEANTVYLGSLPPDPALGTPRTVEQPIIADWNQAHPLLQYIRDLGLVRISKATVVDLPPGAVALMETGSEALAFARPRGPFTDVVIGFGLLDGATFNTDWPIRSYSFPLFIFNVLRELGHAGDAGASSLARPGAAVTLRADPGVRRLTVTAPGGGQEVLERTPQGTFVASRTERVGLYRAEPDEGALQAFAVNQLDPRESDLATRGMVPEGTPASAVDAYRIKIGYTAVTGTRRSMPSVQEWWKPLALLALAVVLAEWYVYNRRVYV